jgi:endonuclease III
MKIEVPDIKTIYEEMMNAVSRPISAFGEDSSVQKTILERIQDYNNDLVKKNKKCNFEKIIKFCIALLMRATSEKFMIPTLKYLINEYNSVEDVLGDVDFKEKTKMKLKELQYRYSEKGATVILNATKIFHTEYNSDIEEYLKLSQAPENLADDFTADTMIKIKNVKYKVRDLGISMFLNNYIALDTHIIRILLRTGLILNSYTLGIAPYSDQNNSARYLDIWRTVKSLAEGAKIPLGELDRAFWNFGRSICKSQNPKCDDCPISKICCFNRYKQN